MAFTRPPSTSVKHGLGCPSFGTVPTDLLTTAPAPFLSMRSMDGPVSSIIPDATMPGFSRASRPTSVLSFVMPSQSSNC
jgi:hypothetical protein